VRLDEVARRGGGAVEVRRIAEHVQLDPALMADLQKVDAVPGNVVEVAAQARPNHPVVLSGKGCTIEVDGTLAHAVLGRRR
jgi:DtxR family Mn-dependent transcriptional regulator